MSETILYADLLMKYSDTQKDTPEAKAIRRHLIKMGCPKDVLEFRMRPKPVNPRILKYWIRLGEASISRMR